MSDHASVCTRASLLVSVVGAASCFSPNVSKAGPDDSTSDDGDSDGSDAGPGPSSTSVVDTTDATETTVATTAGTTATTDATTVETSDATTVETTGATTQDDDAETSTTDAPPGPYCGDGNVDDGEQCDDGDENALNGGCKPDCTAATCGDGETWDGMEACDDGVLDNVLEVGACAPDCSRVIEERVITVGETPASPDLGANPVAAADSLCEPGFNAMFAYSGVREAALLAHDPSGAIDWVLQPYTAYVRENGGALVWITDETPLLGVRDGVPGPLDGSIYPACPDGAFCVIGRIMTGMDPDWTTSDFDNCDEWTSGSADDDMRRGLASSVTTYLYDPEWTSDCDFSTGIFDPAQVYCVEQ